MSARRSWDVERKPAPRREARAAAEPARRPPRQARQRQAPASKRPARSSNLRRRRFEKRKALLIALGILALLVLGVLIFVLWLPALRVEAIEVDGRDPGGMAQAAQEAISGRHFLVVPENSILLLDQDDIRKEVLARYPDVQAISISATGLTSLSIKTHVRASAFTWCGEAVENPADRCYEADAEGLVFAPVLAPPSDATGLAVSGEGTTTEIVSKSAPQADEGAILVYGPLESDGDSPIRSRVAYASALPGALKFMKAMRSLDADIASVTLREDEVDLHTVGGTRITYVIGKEEEAAALAATAFPTINVNDGSIEYIDLRFDNKIYLKRTIGGE